MKLSAFAITFALLWGTSRASSAPLVNPNLAVSSPAHRSPLQQSPPHGQPLPGGAHLEPDGHESTGENPKSPPHNGYPIPTAGSGTNALPLQPGALGGIDLTNWSLWWYFNREGLLDLRRRFDEVGFNTGKTPTKPAPTRPSNKSLQNVVLPALFGLAGEKQQDNVRGSAAIALARIATPESDSILAVLQSLTQERDPGLREATTLALGVNGDPRVIKTLADILAGGTRAKQQLGFKPNDRVRAFAAFSLGLVADRAANDDIRRVALRPVLERFLDTKERDDIRVALASALGMMQIEFDPQGVRPHKKIKGLQSQPRYRGELLSILWKAYDDEREPLVRGHLPVALARLLRGAPAEVRDAGIARLLARLDDSLKPWELYGVLSALGVVGEAWGKPSDHALRQTLYDQAANQRDSHARHLAMIALSEVVANSGPSLPPKSVQSEFETFLEVHFKEGRKADRAWVAMAAGSFGARLRTPIPGRRGARAKGRVGGEIVALLRQTIRSGGSPDDLSAAIIALGLIQDPIAGEDLEHLLDTTSSKTVRGYIALSLGLLGRTSAYGKLTGLIDYLRYEPLALENAAMGLALLNRPKGSQLIRDRLAVAYNGFTAAPLASALGRVADNASILILAAVSREQFQTLATRQSATAALGLISDRDDLTWRSSLASDINYAAWTPTLFDSAQQGVLDLF